ncbi:MAG TPA: TolC family protein [Bacillota bacterium]|nr:TolC family protein [Bacillota bacterium]
MLKTCLLIMLSLTLVFPLEILKAATPENSPEQLSLAKCLELSFQNSQPLKLATENLKLAKEYIREAESKYWPLITYEYGYQHTNPGELWFINPYTMDWQRKPEEGYGASVTLTQPIFTGGKIAANLAIAKQQLNVAVEEERKAKQQLVFNIKEAYYGVWLAEQELNIAKTAYDNMEQHVQQIQKLRQIGNSSKFDLLSAQVQRDRLKPLFIKAGNQLAFTKLTLATLIGYGKKHLYTITNDDSLMTLPFKNEISIDDALTKAYEMRPEMRQVKQSFNVTRQQLKIAKAGYLPDLALSLKYNAEGLESSVSEETRWIFTIGLSGVFFDGFGTQARVQQAETGIRMIQMKEADLQDRIRLEVEQSLQSLDECLEIIHANQSNIDLAKESLRMTKIRFEAGLATTMDIVDSQLALDEALNGYFEGLYHYILAGARFNLVTGQD